MLDDQTGVDPDRIAELFTRFEVQLVDLSTGNRINAVAEHYDYLQAAADPKRSLAVPAIEDIAKIGRRSQYMPVYELVQDGRVVQTILPVYGKGMWSEIHAYIALDASLTEITDLVIHSHGETPGIGDRIESKQWLAQWRGKSTNAPIRIGGTAAQGAMDPSQAAANNRIDAITGATITSQSLVAIVNFWLGDFGYGPLLATTTPPGD